LLWGAASLLTLGLLTAAAGMTITVLQNRLLLDEVRLIRLAFEADLDPCTQPRWTCDNEGTAPAGRPAVLLGPLGGWWSGPWWYPGEAIIALSDPGSPGRIRAANLAATAAQVRDLVMLQSAFVLIVAGAIAWAWGPLRARRRVRRLERSLRDLAAGRDTRATDRDAMGAALGEAVAALAAARDRLLRTERVAALGWFAGGMAHQFGNPLAAARQYAAVLERRLSPDDPSHVAAVRLSEQLDRLHRAVEGMLRLARPERLERRPVALAALLRRLIAELGAGLDRPFAARLEIDDNLAPLSDAPALEQIVVNLLRNAAEAQPEDVRIEVGAVVVDGRCLISLRDYGPGLPPGGVQPLGSDKAQGSGLGLPLAQRLAELLDGRLTLADAPDGPGALAVIDLPVGPAAKRPVPDVS
jgi:signal transduction histidine kinase